MGRAKKVPDKSEHRHRPDQVSITKAGPRVLEEVMSIYERSLLRSGGLGRQQIDADSALLAMVGTNQTVDAITFPINICLVQFRLRARDLVADCLGHKSWNSLEI